MKGFFSLFKSSEHEFEPTLAHFEEARSRIAPYIPQTALTVSPRLSELLGREVYLKWENKLRTGSFKERGALNFLLSLSDSDKSRGVCAASAGNHALALSFYSSKLAIPCKIVMPRRAPLVKVTSTQKYGAEVILTGDTFNAAYDYARDLAKREGKTFVPPFDHPAIIAGQGTIGLELHEQLPDLDAVVVPVGGGGLVSGIAAALKLSGKEPYVLGAQSNWVVQMRASEGTSRPSPFSMVTIAEGIAVKSIGKFNAPIITRYVDSLVSVQEAEIEKALLTFLEAEHTVVEGAGAAGLAALMTGGLGEEYKKVVIIVSGSNIDTTMLSRLIERSMATSGRIARITVALPDTPGVLTKVSTIIADRAANVLEVEHDRWFADTPAHVRVSFVLEVRDSEHATEISSSLSAQGFQVIG